MKKQLQKYIDYIKLAGGSPYIGWFDEDWEPIGPAIRKRLEKANIVGYKNGRIFLKEGKDDHPR